MEIDLPVQQILGIVLLVAGIGYGGATQLPKLWRRFRPTATAPGDAGHNTDAVPPDGFEDHVAVILQASPTAPPGDQIYYCVNGLTEAQVLLAECKRLEALVKGAEG